MQWRAIPVGNFLVEVDIAFNLIVLDKFLNIIWSKTYHGSYLYRVLIALQSRDDMDWQYALVSLVPTHRYVYRIMFWSLNEYDSQ